MKLKDKDNCSIFLTAGFPELNSAVKLVPELAESGADLIELGIPFSDPLADGKVIQEASAIAIDNGMTIDLLFQQVEEIKKKTAVPIVLMGYFNPVLKHGVEAFLKACNRFGIAGVILPDLPVDVYEEMYVQVFDQYEIPMIFLITPSTSAQRIRKIERLSKGFIYFVSSGSITGKTANFSDQQIEGFKRIKEMKLSVPVLTGFGIHNHRTFRTVCDYTDGAIIGSAFIRTIQEGQSVKEFMRTILEE